MSALLNSDITPLKKTDCIHLEFFMQIQVSAEISLVLINTWTDLSEALSLRGFILPEGLRN